MTTDIFAPKELSQKLREIGFDEPCMAFYQDYEGFDNLYVDNFATDESTSTLTDTIFVGNHNIGEDEISAPTWEQVFKWFRERGYHYKIIPNLSGKYNVAIRDLNIIWVYMKNINTYEQARENLTLELIELYKNEKEKI